MRIHDAMGMKQACEQLERLSHESHAGNHGPLTMGEIHEAAFEIERLLGDRSAAARHFTEMERWYGLTGAASLAQRCEELQKIVRSWQADNDQGATAIAVAAATLTRRLNTVDRLLAGGSMSLAERARKALRILEEKCAATSAALYLLDAHGQLSLAASSEANGVEPAVEEWLRARMPAK